MAEHAEAVEAEAPGGIEPIAPTTGLVIGLRKGRSRDSHDPKLDAFLDEQTRLTRLQTEHLHEQREVALSRLKLGRLKDRVTLAQQGLTGQVVASRVLDRLAELQTQTVTGRPASTYANDWGDVIKVEIPETGVSIGELNRYLREWLGHETRVTGEIVRTASGLQLTARAGEEAGTTVQGAETDMDALIGRSAEAEAAKALDLSAADRATLDALAARKT